MHKNNFSAPSPSAALAAEHPELQWDVSVIPIGDLPPMDPGEPLRFSFQVTEQCASDIQLPFQLLVEDGRSAQQRLEGDVTLHCAAPLPAEEEEQRGCGCASPQGGMSGVWGPLLLPLLLGRRRDSLQQR